MNNVRVQDARFQQLVTQYQNTVLQANAEAENALVAFLKAQQQVRWLRKSTMAAEQSVELVQSQYTGGLTDFNRVLDDRAEPDPTARPVGPGRGLGGRQPGAALQGPGRRLANAA